MKIIYAFIIYLLFTSFSKAETDSLTIIRHEFYQSTEDTSAYVRIIYPQIAGLRNSAIQNKINSFLKTEFMQANSWFEDFIADTDYISEFPPDWAFSFECDFRITYNSNEILSLVLDYYEFTGGAHGNYYSVGYNIRVSDGEPIYLNNILKPNSIQALSEFCVEEILDMFDANSLNDAGFFEDALTISDDQDFFITPDDLVIQFDPYEVAPFAMGSIEVKLNFGKIKNILRENLPFLNQ